MSFLQRAIITSSVFVLPNLNFFFDVYSASYLERLFDINTLQSIGLIALSLISSEVYSTGTAKINRVV